VEDLGHAREPGADPGELLEALVTEAVPGPLRADGRQGPRYAAAADFWTISSWIQDGCVQA
jgi:hypothetical protein